MKNILCTWEIGGDLGHLARLSPLARKLAAQGSRVTVALKDLSRAGPLFNDLDVTVMQAPVWLPKISMQRPIACMADTLLLLGYLEADPLLALVRAWQALIHAVKPDLLICDYSPTAQLAAWQSGIPLIVTGTGFAEPVPGHPLADWRPWQADDGLVQRQEQRVLGTINSVLQRQHKPALQQFSDLYRADATVITGFPEFDLYQPLRQGAIYAPGHTNTQVRPPVQWPTGGDDRVHGDRIHGDRIHGDHILAYLKPHHPQLPLLLEALSRSNARTFIACPGGNPAQFQPLASARFAFSTDMVALEAAMPQADLFVGHGNMGSVNQSLLAGKPIIALPIQLEQLLTGKRLETLGLGRLVEKIESAQQLTGLIDAALGSAGDATGLAATARAFASRHADTLSATPTIAACATRLLG